MKKQNKTYILLAIVIGIWGFIGYQFFSAANPSQPELAEAATDQIFVPKQMKERETFTIVANYRDPFLGTVQAPPKKTKKRKVSTTQKRKEAPKKLIQYTGFITDSNSKQKIFFVTVEGQQQMMSAGDTFQEVKLVRGTKTAIKVQYNGSAQTIGITE